MSQQVFKDAVMGINEVLVSSPTALQISLEKEEGRHTYKWVDRSLPAINARKKARKILKDAWAAGAFNYQQFADALRVDVLAIRGLIDEDMLREFPHLAKRRI